MKKIITLIIVAGLALTIQAQDITNTLSATGNFNVNKNDGTTNLFTLSETGDHSMRLSASEKAFTINNSDGKPIFKIDDFANYLNLSMIKLGHADVNFLPGFFAHLQLQASDVDGFDAGNKLNFVGINIQNDLEGYFARGTIATPAAVEDNNSLLNMRGRGHDGTTYRTAAFIQFKVDGTPASLRTPGKIVFGTGSTAEAPAIRMTIKGDGTVNIADLDMDANAYVLVDADGNLYSSTSVPTAPALNSENQKLNEEIETLKSEMAELRKMLEILMEEK